MLLILNGLIGSLSMETGYWEVGGWDVPGRSGRSGWQRSARVKFCPTVIMLWLGILSAKADGDFTQGSYAQSSARCDK